VLTLLVAGFPRETIDAASETIWLKLLEDLDAQLTTEAVLFWIKTEPRFPTMSDIRQAVRLRKGREASDQERLALMRTTTPLEVPAFVKQWQKSVGWA